MFQSKREIVSQRYPALSRQLINPSFPECGQKDRICKEHPDAKGCKNDDGKPIPCYQHGILGSGGHDNRCHYPGPPFHPCGFHGFQLIHGKCIKNIFINVHTHTSGGSSGSNNLSDECYDAIKIAWLGKVQRGDSHEVDDFIDNCLDIKQADEEIVHPLYVLVSSVILAMPEWLPFVPYIAITAA